MQDDEPYYFGVHALHVWRIYQTGTFSVRINEGEKIDLTSSTLEDAVEETKTLINDLLEKSGKAK